MSHYSVLVIEENRRSLDEIMYPFWELDLSHEDLINDPRSVPEVFIGDGLLEDSFIGWKIENRQYQKEHNFESAEKWVDDWHGYYKVPGGYGICRNPNAKWDWYSVGGRWKNMLLMKNGELSDVARKEDIDFDGMNASFAKDAGEHYDDCIMRAVPKYGPTIAYHLYGIHQNEDKEHYMIMHSKLITFAMIYNGVWYARGNMGWWGFVSDEISDEKWTEMCLKMIDSAKDDAIFAIVDCHI